MTATIEAARTPGAVAAPAPLLSVNNIEVVYDDVILVLRGLSLAVPKGAIVALLGANGAGKSTTLKAISGLLKTEDGEVTRGEIVFNGERINGIDPDKIVRRGIFQVMEGRRIISDMTSLEICGSAPSPAATTRSVPTSTWSTTTSRASRSAPDWPAISPAANSRCWRSAAP